MNDNTDTIAVLRQADLLRLRLDPTTAISFKMVDDDVCRYRVGQHHDPAVNVASTNPLGGDHRRWLRVDCNPPKSWRRVGGEWMRERVMLVPDASHAFLTNVGLIESDLLSDKCVAVVGLGSGGSTIVTELAKAGVGQFILADFDRIEVQNVGRHICGLRDIGRRKTIAMRDQVLARNPAAKVELFHGDVVKYRSAMEPLLDKADVIVAATDTNASRMMLNQFAVDAQTATVFGRVHQRGSGGDVMIVRPNGPCYHCAFGELMIEEEVSTEPRDLPVYSTKPVMPMPGLSLDVAPIALMCARLVLTELCRGSDTAFKGLAEDLRAPMFVWANRRTGQFKEWEPMGLGFTAMSIQRWYGIGVQIDETCPVCQPEAFSAQLRREHPT